MINKQQIEKWQSFNNNDIINFIRKRRLNKNDIRTYLKTYNKE
jgi:hypothetical protein